MHFIDPHIYLELTVHRIHRERITIDGIIELQVASKQVSFNLESFLFNYILLA